MNLAYLKKPGKKNLDIYCTSINTEVPLSLPNSIKSDDALTVAKCNDGNEFKLTLSGSDNIVSDSVKSRVSCGNSSLNLADLSTGIDQDNTTYLASADVANVNNMSLVLLPSQAMLYQNSGTIQRMTIDDSVTYLKTKNYVEGVGGSGARLILVDSDATCFMGAGDLNKPSVTLNPLGLRLSSLNQTFQRIMDNNMDAAHVYSPFVGYQVYRDEVAPTYQVFRSADNTERMRISTQGVQINNAYKLPITDGVNRSVLTSNGMGQCSWGPKLGFSSYTRVQITGAAEQSLISGPYRGSTIIPANSFEIGSTWRIDMFGSFNVAPAQQINFLIKMNGITAALTSNMALLNSPASWSSTWILNVRAVGGPGVAVLSACNTSRLDSTVSVTTYFNITTFDTTVSNTINMTAAFVINNADTFTCDSCTLSQVL